MKYKLYGMKPSAENIAGAGEHRYYRATPVYLLIYTAGDAPPKSIPVSVELLSQEDQAWLQKCNVEIIRETVEKSPDARERLVRFMERLETELENERKKVGNLGC